ncbi:MAG: metallophosphoesterase [Methanophagales archaeon ANME-1-THS]|nr:MAG: metallophosphoesterase [Methanophagales archaeon ANME-1-THS]
MKIAQISDIHAADAHLLPDLAENVIKRINELRPEILVVTGDLTDNGYPIEYERAKHYVDRIACAIRVVVPGNHDVRNVGDLGFEEFFGPRSKKERYNGVTILGIDSTQPDIDDGHVGRDKYTWIEQSLNTKDFKIVALHHHLIPVPKTGRESSILRDAGDLLELLVRCKVDLVLCGHKHVPWVWDVNGMIILNAGTACTNRVKWNIPQSFNLIEVDESAMGAIKIHRMYSCGGEELVFEQKRG